MHIFRHTNPIPANIHKPAPLQNPPHLLPILTRPHQMRHILLLRLLPTKRHVQLRERAVLAVLLQLGSVEKVLRCAPTSKVENCFSVLKVAPFLRQHLPPMRALLKKPAKGGDAGAGANHEHGFLHTFGQLEIRGADKNTHLTANLQPPQIAGAHPPHIAPTRGPVLHQTRGEMHAIGVAGSAGRDGVVADLEDGEQLEEELDGGLEGGEVCEDLEEIAAIFGDPAREFGSVFVQRDGFQECAVLLRRAVRNHRLQHVRLQKRANVQITSQRCAEATRLRKWKLAHRHIVALHHKNLLQINPQSRSQPPNNLPVVSRKNTHVVTRLIEEGGSLKGDFHVAAASVFAEGVSLEEFTGTDDGGFKGVSGIESRGGGRGDGGKVVAFGAQDFSMLAGKDFGCVDLRGGESLHVVLATR
eukprot:Sdes_comp20853_c0_seq2m17619